jgi:hypothetical protein
VDVSSIDYPGNDPKYAGFLEVKGIKTESLEVSKHETC